MSLNCMMTLYDDFDKKNPIIKIHHSKTTKGQILF